MRHDHILIKSSLVGPTLLACFVLHIRILLWGCGASVHRIYFHVLNLFLMFRYLARLAAFISKPCVHRICFQPFVLQISIFGWVGVGEEVSNIHQ